MGELPAGIWDTFSETLAKRLRQQIRFVLEIDRLKQVVRQTPILDGSRKENDAEHSWHLALMAIVLSEYAADKVDVLRVLKMVLIHDIVEIDAGDTFCYDAEASANQNEREECAAERLFGLLPSDQGAELRALWEEFERRESADARFAAALDRLQPLLHNYVTRGGTWREHSVGSAKVRQRNSQIEAGSPELWKFAANIIDAAVAEGILMESGKPTEGNY